MTVSKKIRLRVIRLRNPLILFAASSVGLVGLLFFRLKSSVPGLSASEAASLASSVSWSQIINNPLNMPYKLAVFGLVKWQHGGVFMLRSVSAIFAIAMIYLFYYVLRQWYARRTAILGTTLFATSSWLLHYARLAQPDIMYIALIAAITYGTWLRQTKKTSLVIVVGGLLAVFLLYIPGLIWLVIAGGWWQRRSIFKHYRHYTVTGLIMITVSAGLLVPLIYGLATHPNLIRQLFGLQLPGYPDVWAVLRSIAIIPYQLAVHANVNPVVWLGNLPLLDVFALAMLVLGIYKHFFMRGLDRARVLLGIAVISVVLIGFGIVNTIILLPVLYILVASGIGLMLQQWFTVFPRNPLAGLIGTTLISLAVLMTMFYHINHYYIAWPNSNDTKSVFIVKP